MTIYHVIEGVFFALNWNTFRGEACVQLMHGEPSKGILYFGSYQAVHLSVLDSIDEHFISQNDNNDF